MTKYPDDTDGPAGHAALIRALPPLLQPLALRGVIKRYRKGVRIVDEGTSGDMFFILLKGRVKAFSADDVSDREITFAIDRAGDYFGEMALDGGVRSASVVALDASICSVVTAKSVWQFADESPQFARELIVKLISRTRWTTEHMRELALLTAYARLVRLLESLAGLPDENGVRRIDELLTQRDLAGHVGCSRVMVGKLLHDLEEGGYIQKKGKAILILKKLPARW